MIFANDKEVAFEKLMNDINLNRFHVTTPIVDTLRDKALAIRSNIVSDATSGILMLRLAHSLIVQVDDQRFVAARQTMMRIRGARRT